MQPCVFRSSVLLDAPIEAVYAFHADPRNISQIAPPWLRATVLRAEPDARPGDEFELEITMFATLTMRWVGRWQSADSPTLLADEGLRAGPFAYWLHRHEFRAISPTQTEMTDLVTYAFPLGWLGKLTGETVGRLQMHQMFADRHHRTRAFFNAAI